MGELRQGVIERLVGRLNLRFPALFVVFAALTLADMIVPDCIPFVDEIGLALLTVIFGLWRQRKAGTPERSEP